MVATAQEKKPRDEKYRDPINVEVPALASDKGVKLDYARAPRAGDDKQGHITRIQRTLKVGK